jgi:hypothetical protein
MIKTIVISIIIANGSLVEVRDLDVSCVEVYLIKFILNTKIKTIVF